MIETAAPRTWRGDDFPSWLSPMLVRELRQGLQSGAFAWTFVGLQAAMFFLLVWGTLAAGDPAGRGTAQACGAFFWVITAVVVAVVVPLRGLAGVSGERAGNNLDLVRLTRLSATRIILGKWLANAAQALLVAVSILPYVVLRYFLGGINVLRDLEGFGWICAAALFVAAAALALSTLPEAPRRAIVGLASFQSLFGLVFVLEGGLVRMFGFLDLRAKLGILAVVVVYTVALLEYAAARIAPPAENHALRKRGIATAVAVAWLSTAAAGSAATAAATISFTLPLLLAIAIGALLERPTAVTSMAAGFTRLGVPGRLAARLFLPGWAAGLPWVLAAACACAAAVWTTLVRHGRGDAGSAMAIVGLVVAAVLFPLPAIVLLPRVRQRFPLYLLVQVGCFAAFVLAAAIKPFALAWSDWPAGWGPLLPLPVAALASFLRLDRAQAGLQAWIFTVAALGVIAVVLVSVAPAWLRGQREIGRLLAAAAARRSPGARP